MAKNFPNIETLKVYQKGGDNQDVKKCPDATTDTEVNIDNRERSIARANYTKSSTEDKCGNCIFFDISSRMKKCMDTKSDNKGYCWDQEFVCSPENVCDFWEVGGPLKSNDSSYMKDESYESEYNENKEEVEEIQTAQQMPIAGQEQQQEMPQMMAQQGPPQGPPQAMAPPQQAPPQEQMQPSYAYGGSLRKAQESLEIDYTIDPETGQPFDQTPVESMADRTIRLEAEAEEKRLAGLDDNTDIFDAANKEKGNTLKDKYKDWRTKRGIRRRNRSVSQDQNFIPWNAPPEQGIPGQVANWFKSVGQEFSNYDVDPNKITNKEFRNYKKLLKEQYPDKSNKEIRNLAKSVFPSHGNNRWGKENYQQFKITNPHDDPRFFNPAKPDELQTLGQRNAEGYNKFATYKTTTYPELYQVSSMDNEGNITYTGDKLLGDLYETEYMPDVQSLQYNEEGTIIMGGNFYTGMKDGKKQYQYVPFDPANPMNHTYTRNGQQTENDCIELMVKCKNSTPPGVWDGENCKCKWEEDNDQSKSNEGVIDKNIDNIEFDEDLDLQLGGTPSYAFMRDGGDLTMFQSKNEWDDDQLQQYLKLQVDMYRNSGIDPTKIDISNKKTWPSTWGTIADGTYNSMFPWLPDMSTAEGKSSMYRLHREAVKKFPEQSFMPEVYWGTDEEGGAYPYSNESRTEEGERTGTIMNKQLTQFNEDIKNVKSKTELNNLIENTYSTLDPSSMMYIINQANANNDIDISNDDYIEIMQGIDQFRSDNAGDYENIEYSSGEAVRDHKRSKWGEVTLNEDYQYNPHTYKDFSLPNPKAEYETHGPGGKPWMPGTGWIANFDNFFRATNLEESEKAGKYSQPTQVWDENANNGKGGWISIPWEGAGTKGGTFTNATNQGTRQERVHISNMLMSKGIIPEGASNEEADAIIDKFVGGSGNVLGNYINTAFDNTLPNQGREYNSNPDYMEFMKTFGNPTFQESSDSNPNQQILSKEDALNFMKLKSHYNSTDNLPSEIYGNKTGNYNPNVPGITYLDEATGENVWVANPEYNSDFSKGFRGDFEGSKKNIFGNRIDNSSHYKTVGDHWKDNKFMGTLNLAGISENDVDYAMTYPGATFGPLAMEAGPLLRGAGALLNYTKVAPLMNTGLFGSNFTTMNAINTGFGIDMASHVPENIRQGNYGMGLINSLAGVGTAGSLVNRLNRQSYFPKTFAEMKNYNPNLQTLNPKGEAIYGNYANYINKELPAISLSGKPSQYSAFKNFNNPLSTTKWNPTMNLQAPKLNFSNTHFVPPGGFMKGGSLPKAQNGAQDVAAMYMVNPNQFDYETNMPKEGAISSYGDVWQGGQWVDATEEEFGFTTPDSDQFGIVQDAFSDETGITNRNVNSMFTTNAINQDMKTAAADTYDVRRKDIDANTWDPEQGSIHKKTGQIWGDLGDEEMGWADNQFTPQIDFTDDFAFEGDNNTLSRRQARDVRNKNKKYNKRLAKAEEAGFKSWDEMQTSEDEAKMVKKQQRKDRRDRWGDTWGQRIGNKFNYMMDSKAMQTYGKVGQALVQGAGIVNDIFDERTKKDAQDELLVSRSADDVYGVTSADALSRGEHDENTGIFQPDDKVISRWGKYGLELPRAQSQMETGLSVAGPLYDMNGKCYANCQQRSFVPKHNLSIGAKMDINNSGIGMGGYGGYTLNPSPGRRQEGFKGYLGANYGATLGNVKLSNWTQGETEGQGDPTITPYANAITSLGYEGEVGDAGSYKNYLAGRRGDPLKWGLGAYGKYDIMGDDGLTIGGYGHYGKLGITGGYNPNSGWSGGLSIGIPIREEGGEQKTINVNSDMYYELIAAGADLEII